MRENGKKMMFAPRANNSSVLSDPSEFIGIALSGDIERFREYVNIHPDIVNIKEKDNGNVALHIASSKGNVQMASLLLSRGANLNIQDIFGNSPLHYASDKKRKEMVEQLIKCGADVNMKDFRGNTPLHAACVNNDIDIVRILLLNNADPESSDLSDVKPAQKASSPAVKALIERKIQQMKGGDEDQQAKIVTMMSFGIGLGVGLGMAMAKQQQFQIDQRLQQQQLLDAEKKLNKRRPGHAGAFAQSMMSHGYSDSQSLHGSKNNSQMVLQQAGAMAMVVHHGGRPPPPQEHARKLL